MTKRVFSSVTEVFRTYIPNYTPPAEIVRDPSATGLGVMAGARIAREILQILDAGDLTTKRKPKAPSGRTQSK